MTICEQYGMRAVKPYASKHGIDNTVAIPEQIVGIELEIEEFPPDVTHEFGGVTFTNDGSLRNSAEGLGIEAITQPLYVKHVEALLKAFYSKFKIGENNYSERCSTHVHFNVQDFNWEQMSTLCLLYQTVERLLFRFVGHERDAGIFCVPWNQCNMSFAIINKMEKDGNVLRDWQKYSALNLKPISLQGTVEFRHLHGTCDVKTIMTWINIISMMFRYSKAQPLQSVKESILNMNTVSNYQAWLNEVFGAYATSLQVDGYEADLAVGVVDSKLMLMEGPKKPAMRFGRTYIAPLGVVGGQINWNDTDQDFLQVDTLQPPTPTPVGRGDHIGLNANQVTINSALWTIGNATQEPTLPRPAPAPRLSLREITRTIEQLRGTQQQELDRMRGNR